MTVNLLFGLPISDSFKWHQILSEFFTLDGKHIVCGGSTAQFVANFLHKSLVLDLHYINPNIPPVAHIDGVDLVTEGVVTMMAVLDKFSSKESNNDVLDEANDGASLIYNTLCEANEINFFVSTAENPANSEFLFLKSKVEIVNDLAKYLSETGKNVMLKLI